MPERLNHRVQIDVGGRTLSLPWPSGDWLLEQLIHHGERAIVDEFEKVGTSRPVHLGTEQKTKLLEVLEHSAEQTTAVDEDTGERLTGDAALPEGIPELRAALTTELGR